MAVQHKSLRGAEAPRGRKKFKSSAGERQIGSEQRVWVTGRRRAAGSRSEWAASALSIERAFSRGEDGGKTGRS